MASIKISELNEQENRNEQDLLAIVDVNNNETKKVKVKTLAPQNVEIALISDTEPTSGIHQGEMYYNTTTNKLYTYVGGGVYIDNGEPKFGILYIIYSSQTIYTYNGTTLINIGGSGNYSELDGKPSVNGNIINGNKTNTDLGIPNALNEYSDSTEDSYSCNYVNNAINEVNENKQDKEWKLLFSDKKNSDGKINLPENFNELYVVVALKKTSTGESRNITYSIKKIELKDTLNSYDYGFYFTNAVNGSAELKISKTKIKLQEAYLDGDYRASLPNSTYSCWYR